jgi:hypothetical protein
MNYVASNAKTGITLAVLCICVSAASVRVAFSAAPVKHCETPAYRQFDFWIGDWDAFDIDNPRKVIARTRVTRILGGCVLLEDYQGADGHFGQSFTIYDSSRGRWHQTWVTNHGTLLVIEGGLEDGGKMVLQGTDRTTNSATRQVRGMWIPVPGGVQESAVISTDGGKTWIPWFDLIFRRHKP